MFFRSSSSVETTPVKSKSGPKKASRFQNAIKNYMNVNNTIFDDVYEDAHVKEVETEKVFVKKEVLKEEFNKKGLVGFHPKNIRVSDFTIGEFIIGPLEESLQSVPGIKTANEKLLNSAGVNTTHQLVAKYLSLKDTGVDSVELADRFYYWLQIIGVNSHRATIVGSVGEKACVWMPGVYDASEYENDGVCRSVE